ncbi:MAG TPA: allantoicase [Vicinamibacterales bacterium]|nr:allantoicase [Vicinamibacterales bacterium]
MIEFTHLIDLASSRYGGRVIAANDEFFAPKENLLKPEPPIYLPAKYTDRGKWMDGWETRRRRTPGCDWCVIRLGLPGLVRSVVVDTAYFRGNYPAQCSIEGCALGPYMDDEALVAVQAAWWPLLPPSELWGDTQNVFPIVDSRRCTHLRLNIYPDGGVARFRVKGEALPDLGRVFAAGGEIDLASAAAGGCVVDTSDRFYGDPQNMLRSDPAPHMADGWETRRRRGPGHDWAVIRLGVEGTIRRVEVDTAHFKGNYPDRCSVEAGCLESPYGAPEDVGPIRWVPVVTEAPLRADYQHVFEREVWPDVVATHVRLNIFPDGGVSRFRVFGMVTPRGRHSAQLRLFNAMDDAAVRQALADCFGSQGWVERVAGSRPFQTMDEVLTAAEAVWGTLPPDDWLEAMRHHPRIGERRAEREISAASRAWSDAEQASALADAHAVNELREANARYEARFGHVFVIAAEGKGLPQILDALRSRLSHPPDEELAIAARELRQIARLRLEKLLS